MQSRSVRWTTLALATAYGAGCYTYRPVELADLRPNSEVRARVSAAEAERLADMLGGVERRQLDGRVVDNGANGLTMDVSVVSSIDRRGDAISQRLTLPADRVLEVELKELSQGRTGAMFGIVLGGGIALVVSQLYGGAGEDRPGTGDPVEMRIPLRIPIPWGGL